MTHKHAEFLRAIADGESLEDWECDFRSENKWTPVGEYMYSITVDSRNWKMRRKPKTHIVNGFTVPAPLRFAPADGALYFVSSCISSEFFSHSSWSNDAVDKRWLDRGLVHLNKEAATANAKAMCGIDPEAE